MHGIPLAAGLIRYFRWDLGHQRTVGTAMGSSCGIGNCGGGSAALLVLATRKESNQHSAISIQPRKRIAKIAIIAGILDWRMPGISCPSEPQTQNSCPEFLCGDMDPSPAKSAGSGFRKKSYFCALISSRFFAASFGTCGSVMLTGSRISAISCSVSSFFSRAMSMMERPVLTDSFTISAALA